MLMPAVLSHLISASLKEDAYGAVQRDIPRVLEAFLSFLQAMEDYHAEVWGLGPTLDGDLLTEVGEKEREERERMRAEVERAREVLGYVEDGAFSSSSSLVSCIP
jgi:nucleoporin NDC1